MRVAVIVKDKSGAQVAGVTAEDFLKRGGEPVTFGDGYTLALVIQQQPGMLQKLWGFCAKAIGL